MPPPLPAAASPRGFSEVGAPREVPGPESAGNPPLLTSGLGESVAPGKRVKE